MQTTRQPRPTQSLFAARKQLRWQPGLGPIPTILAVTIPCAFVNPDATEVFPFGNERIRKLEA